MKLPAGLLLAGALTACASTHAVDPGVASSASFAQAQTIEVKLSSFDFTPSEIHLVAGTPYTLHIVNEATGGHDFTAPEFFGSSRVAPDDIALVRNGQIELSGGAAATVHLVPAAGTYKLICTHPGHALLGMKGTIIVD